MNSDPYPSRCLISLLSFLRPRTRPDFLLGVGIIGYKKFLERYVPYSLFLRFSVGKLSPQFNQN